MLCWSCYKKKNEGCDGWGQSWQQWLWAYRVLKSWEKWARQKLELQWTLREQILVYSGILARSPGRIPWRTEAQETWLVPPQSTGTVHSDIQKLWVSMVESQRGWARISSKGGSGTGYFGGIRRHCLTVQGWNWENQSSDEAEISERCERCYLFNPFVRSMPNMPKELWSCCLVVWGTPW